MKRLFAVLLAVFGVLYTIAHWTLPRQDGNQAQLSWASNSVPARQMEIAGFMAAEPDYGLAIDSGNLRRVLARASTGTGPDLIDTWNNFHMAGFAEAGILLDLTPHLERYGLTANRVYPHLAEANLYDGRQYRYPGSVNANCIVFNKRVFDSYGLPYPTPEMTWEEFVDLAVALRDRSAGTELIPLAGFQSGVFFRDLLVNFGGRFFSADGLSSALDQPEAIQAMRFYAELVVEKRLLAGLEMLMVASAQGNAGDASASVSMLVNDRLAMLAIGRWVLNLLESQPQMIDDLGVVTFPRPPGRPSRVAAFSRGTAINRDTDQPEAALAFLRFLASDDYARIVVESGDGVPANPAYVSSGADLVNDLAPDPEFHQPFLDAILTSRPIDVSPFFPSNLIVWETRFYAETVESGADPAETMQAWAKTTDARIDRALARSPELRDKFRAITGQEWTPDWRGP